VRLNGATKKTPHDEWDFAGVNQMVLTDQPVKGKMTPLLTHIDRNGIMYTLNRDTGALILADKVDPAVNVFKKSGLKNWFTSARSRVLNTYGP